MNAIVISAVLGVIMMFTGLLNEKKSVPRLVAIAGLIVLLVSNFLELGGTRFFEFDVHNMLIFDSFGLLFNTIAFASTLIFVLLSRRDMENFLDHIERVYRRQNDRDACRHCEDHVILRCC